MTKESFLRRSGGGKGLQWCLPMSTQPEEGVAGLDQDEELSTGRYSIILGNEDAYVFT